MARGDDWCAGRCHRGAAVQVTSGPKGPYRVSATRRSARRPIVHPSATKGAISCHAHVRLHVVGRPLGRRTAAGFAAFFSVHGIQAPKSKGLTGASSPRGRNRMSHNLASAASVLITFYRRLESSDPCGVVRLDGIRTTSRCRQPGQRSPPTEAHGVAHASGPLMVVRHVRSAGRVVSIL